MFLLFQQKNLPRHTIYHLACIATIVFVFSKRLEKTTALIADLVWGGGFVSGTVLSLSILFQLWAPHSIFVWFGQVHEMLNLFSTPEAHDRTLQDREALHFFFFFVFSRKQQLSFDCPIKLRLKKKQKKETARGSVGLEISKEKKKKIEVRKTYEQIKKTLSIKSLTADHMKGWPLLTNINQEKKEKKSEKRGFTQRLSDGNGFYFLFFGRELGG